MMGGASFCGERLVQVGNIALEVTVIQVDVDLYLIGNLDPEKSGLRTELFVVVFPEWWVGLWERFHS